MNKTPSSKQIQAINEQGNLVITAKPGSGKTFTIIEKILRITEDLETFQGVIAISYTRKASTELKTRYNRSMHDSHKHFFGTIDKFYITEIIIPFSKLLFKKTINFEVVNGFDNHPYYKELVNIKKGEDYDEDFIDLLENSLLEGIIFLDIIGETALHILNSVKQAKKYLKARYSHIIIDEYQDCGKVQHDIFMKLVGLGLIGIAVGDIEQAIFGFADRFPYYLYSLTLEKRFKHIELDRNYRCHSSISDYSLELMGFGPPNPPEEKRVFEVQVIGNEIKLCKAMEENLENAKNAHNVTNNNDIAILCRGNATAKFISEHLKLPNKLSVDTPLDNESGLIPRLINDLLHSFFLFKNKQKTALDFVSEYINESLNYQKFIAVLKEVLKLFLTDEAYIFEEIDLIKSIVELIYSNEKEWEGYMSLREMLLQEEKLDTFKPTKNNEISIMTLHKSKGLEFKIVFLMDLYRWILPPEHKQTTRLDIKQSLNLHYVGLTRAIEACYIMQGTERYRSRHNDFIESVPSPFLEVNSTSLFREKIQW